MGASAVIKIQREGKITSKESQKQFVKDSIWFHNLINTVKY